MKLIFQQLIQYIYVGVYIYKATSSTNVHRIQFYKCLCFSLWISIQWLQTISQSQQYTCTVLCKNIVNSIFDLNYPIIIITVIQPITVAQPSTLSFYSQLSTMVWLLLLTLLHSLSTPILLCVSLLYLSSFLICGHCMNVITFTIYMYIVFLKINKKCNFYFTWEVITTICMGKKLKHIIKEKKFKFILVDIFF